MLRITRTENGTVRGIQGTDARITVFKGIPFAAPPVGELRWRAPQPAADWKGVRACLEFMPIAMQRVPGSNLNTGAFYAKEWHVDPDVPMDEDCLYLNIWTNAKTGKEEMPVMVWIYGGGLMEGYPWEMEFDGERIASRGVILVSVNYRLNVFGFLTHPEIIKASPDGFVANFGYLDQKAGIDWVRRNIANFGGDPNNITIFGQSAGGGSVMAHVNSPLAKGAFQKAIVQSGGGVRIKEPSRRMMIMNFNLQDLAPAPNQRFKLEPEVGGVKSAGIIARYFRAERIAENRLFALRGHRLAEESGGKIRAVDRSRLLEADALSGGLIPGQFAEFSGNAWDILLRPGVNVVIGRNRQEFTCGRAYHHRNLVLMPSQNTGCLVFNNVFAIYWRSSTCRIQDVWPIVSWHQ